MGFCVADEELELELDGRRPAGGVQLPQVSKRPSSRQTVNILYSHFRVSDCTQVKSTTQSIPDAVRNALADGLKMFLQVCKFLSGESRCVWLRARGEAGRSWGHKVVSWGGWGVNLQQAAAANRRT